MKTAHRQARLDLHQVKRMMTYPPHKMMAILIGNLLKNLKKKAVLYKEVEGMRKS